MAEDVQSARTSTIRDAEIWGRQSQVVAVGYILTEGLQCRGTRLYAPVATRSGTERVLQRYFTSDAGGARSWWRWEEEGSLFGSRRTARSPDLLSATSFMSNTTQALDIRDESRTENLP